MVSPLLSCLAAKKTIILKWSYSFVFKIWYQSWYNKTILINLSIFSPDPVWKHRKTRKRTEPQCIAGKLIVVCYRIGFCDSKLPILITPKHETLDLDPFGAGIYSRRFDLDRSEAGDSRSWSLWRWKLSILNVLEQWLLPWGPGREWEFFLLDAYAPGLTDNVQRLCWTRGYICFTHGGGASMVAQTNDTDHHAHVRKRFIELQTDLMIRKARRMGGGMVDLTPEENLDIMIQVMSDQNLITCASK